MRQMFNAMDNEQQQEFFRLLRVEDISRCLQNIPKGKREVILGRVEREESDNPLTILGKEIGVPASKLLLQTLEKPWLYTTSGDLDDEMNNWQLAKAQNLMDFFASRLPSLVNTITKGITTATVTKETLGMLCRYDDSNEWTGGAIKVAIVALSASIPANIFIADAAEQLLWYSELKSVKDRHQTRNYEQLKALPSEGISLYVIPQTISISSADEISIYVPMRASSDDEHWSLAVISIGASSKITLQIYTDSEATVRIIYDLTCCFIEKTFPNRGIKLPAFLNYGRTIKRIRNPMFEEYVDTGLAVVSAVVDLLAGKIPVEKNLFDEATVYKMREECTKACIKAVWEEENARSTPSLGTARKSA